jgi:hypothetical protein
MDEELKWTELQKGLVVKAKPDGLWTKGPLIVGPTILKIEAKGTWRYSATFAEPCTADGDLTSPFDLKKCVWDKSPVGSLIGRIGGSSADKDPTYVFAVGTSCIRAIDQNTKGLLFLTINDMWVGFGDNSGELTVNVYFAAA